ncbi:MAG: outer membrane protein assembly factor BamB family protein [Planctomycetota bacterium]
MRGVTVCETHENERVIARCTVCGRGVCKQCRDAFGYYCSQACREKGSRRSMGPTEEEERRQLSEFGKKLDRWLGIFKWRVVPGAAVLIALVIIYKVTSDEGEVIWEFRPPRDLPFSGLTIAGDTVLVSCGKTLRALDARTGEARWAFEAEGKLSEEAPIIAKPGLCLVSDKANIYAVDVARGSQAWRHAMPGPPDGEPLVGGGAVVASCGVFREPTDEERRKAVSAGSLFGTRAPLGSVRTGTVVVALGVADGKELWSRTLEGDGPLAGLALGDGPLYTCRSTFDEKGFRTVLEAADPATGETRWTKELPAGVFSSLLAAGEDVLVSSGEGLVCFSADGEERWRSPGGAGHARPVVEGGKVYCAFGEGLACLDRGTGKQLWRIAEGASGHPFSVGGGLVFVASFRTEALRRPKATIDLPKPKAEGVEDLIKPYTEPALPDERSVGVMHAFDAATGKLVWTADGVGGRVVPAGARAVAVDTRAIFNLMDAASTSASRLTSLRAGSGAELWSHARDGSVTSAVATPETLIFTSQVVVTHTSAMFAAPEPPKRNTVTAISLVR